MPTPTVIAGLVMGAVLGVGLLCLGAYTVHRYMNWRCRELVDVFQRNTVRVVKIEDLEPGNKTQEKDLELNKGRIAAAVDRTSGRQQRQQVSDRVHDMEGLRGGHDHEALDTDPTWVDKERIQPDVPRPARINIHATTHPPTLGWNQPVSTYDQLWHPSAIFQQPAPQGGYYAYIPPHPDAAIAFAQPLSGHAGPQPGFLRQAEQKQAHNEAAPQIRGNPGPRLERTGSAFIDVRPVAFECDSIVVVDDFDFLVEGVTHHKGKAKKRDSKKRRKAEHRESVSTQLGTCSSSESSTSTMLMHQDCISDVAPPHARLSSHSCSCYREYTRRPARAGSSGNNYARHSYRRSGRQERKGDDDGRAALRWISHTGGQRLAVTANKSIAEIRLRGGGSISGGVPTSGCKAARSAEVGDASTNLTATNSESSPDMTDSDARAPDRAVESTSATDPPTSAMYCAKLQRATDGAAPQGMVEDTRSEPEMRVPGNVSTFLAPIGAPTKDYRGSCPQGPRMSMSHTNCMMTTRRSRSREARLGREREGSISTEASFHREDRG